MSPSAFEPPHVLRLTSGHAAVRLRGMQSDFGGYDPCFLGLTIHLRSDRAVEIALSEPGDAAADVGLQQAESEGADALFERLALSSVRIHETRHFHDSLVAPIGAEIFWRRFLITFYGLQLISLVRDLAAELEKAEWLLPVPLTRWLQADERARSEWTERWCRHFGAGVRVLDLCDADHDLGPDSARLIDTVNRHSAEMAKIFREDWQVSRDIRSMHVFEASALLAQWVSIGELYGEARAQHFIDCLFGDPRSAYAAALEFMRVIAVARGSDEPGLPALQAALTWSQIGYEEKVDESKRPLVRLARLVKWLAKRGLPSTAGVADARRVFDEWDAALGEPSTFDGLMRSVRDDELMAKRIQAAAEGEPSRGQAFAKVMLPSLQMWLDARRSMVSRFVANPGLYCDPIGYVRSGPEEYLSPASLYMLGAGSIPAEAFHRLGAARYGYIPLETIGEGENGSVIAFGEISPKGSEEELEQAYDVTRWHMACDYLYSESRRDLSGYEKALARETLGSRLRPVEILS